MTRALLIVPLAIAAISTAALAQPGIDFVTITNPGNPAYQSPNPNDYVNGRGSVNYPYRIGRDEITTAQWVSFYNAAYDRPANDRIPFLSIPTFWGAASTTPNTPGGLRWTVPPGNEMRAVGNISWRTAAIFCNWLCNGQSTDRSAFLNGAYDVSTFGINGTIFTDQAAHNPGAAYWVPTFDEMLKASHWSPNNPNNGGWYTYSNASDSPYVYGPPGVGQANAGFDTPDPFSIPLGSYPAVQSPWGLLDVAGGTTEWTETIVADNFGTNYRVFDGSYWGQSAVQAALIDSIRQKGGEHPFVDTHEFGFRIASAIPSPGSCTVVSSLVFWLAKPRRRSPACPTHGLSSSR